MKKFLLICFVIGFASQASAQYFQFSQYNFADARVTPTAVAQHDFASIGFIYRNQGTASEITLNSNLLSVTYPFISRTSGKRWSGIGVTLMDDRSGGLFKIQEGSLSYAGNVFLNDHQSIQLGIKALYQQRSLNLDGLRTGAQYVADRGFDENLPTGENFGTLNASLLTFSSGFSWQNIARDGVRTGYASLALFDFNKVDEAFLDVASPISKTWVAHAGFRLFKESNMSVFPEALYTRSASNDVLNIGLVTRCDVKGTRTSAPFHVDVITKYVVDRSGIFGLQFHNDGLSLGFSYDFHIDKKNISNIGAFEIALVLKRLVLPAEKTSPARKAVPKKPTANESRTLPKQKPEDKVEADPVTDNSFAENIKHRRDSVIAANHGNESIVEVDKAILYFNFQSNSSALDDSSIAYLDELAQVLKEDVHLRVTLIGHTDNIGTAAFNERLSVARANRVKAYLISKGVGTERISADGKGMTEPLNANRTEEERAKNRRVELLLLYQQ